LIDVEGIGAGGGSIAWVDAGGALNVGPASAGADPGPACYGRGGAQPTVTDANLVLGRLNPDYFLGGEMKLDVDAARQAIQRRVVEPIAAAGGPTYSVPEAAAGIIRVVNANMIRGIGGNTTQKGYDVREFSLLAFGGAGALHAAELAQEMGIGRVIIPPFCAVFSAFGAVASDVRHDYVQTVALSQKEASVQKLQAALTALEAKARAQLKAEKVAQANIVIEWALDLRYEGQSYELTVPVPRNGGLTEATLARVVADFHAMHQRIYAYGDPTEPVEFISARLAGIGKVPPVKLGEETQERQPKSKIKNQKSERPVYFLSGEFLPAQIYRRPDLAAGDRFAGPCLIEEQTSTTVVPPGARGIVDRYGNLVIELE
ncbi:MAG: hydantoinase/oxoprolinase family protein, partial [Anaerolineae bacterium]